MHAWSPRLVCHATMRRGNMASVKHIHQCSMPAGLSYIAREGWLPFASVMGYCWIWGIATYADRRRLATYTRYFRWLTSLPCPLHYKRRATTPQPMDASSHGMGKSIACASVHHSGNWSKWPSKSHLASLCSSQLCHNKSSQSWSYSQKAFDCTKAPWSICLFQLGQHSGRLPFQK